MKLKLRNIRLLFYLFFFCFVTSCSTFYRHDFVERKILVTVNDEVIFYDIFQTNIDNYNFIFYSSYRKDTTKMFTYNVNDAVYTALRLNTSKQNDTLFIEMNMPTKILTGKTKAGNIYQLKPKL